MKKIIYTIIIGGVLFSGTTEKTYIPKEKKPIIYPLKEPEKKDPSLLKENYISKKELRKILTKLDNLIPGEFSKKDLEKIARIESSLNTNAYREDIFKKRINGKIEKDTIRQAGIYQVAERTYNSFERESPFLIGAFNPYKNTKSFLKNLRTIKNFYKRNIPNWENLTSQKKQKYLIAGHNYGIGRIKKKGFDLSKIPRITKNFIKKFYEMY